MASDVNNKPASSLYCQGCGAANPVQSTQCFACGEPLSTSTGGSGATTNPLTGSLLLDTIVQQRYRILEVLRTDEVSTLYKAEDLLLGNRMVALKEIGQKNPGEQEMIEASKREMLLLAGLIHPNLPRIYDYFVENQRWYFVMDFLEGETLEAYLRKPHNRSLPTEEVLDIGIQLSTVLDYLHIHQSPLGFKDLSLDTTWRSSDGRLYLLDTGTAPPAATMPGSSSIANLGRLLRQVQAGKTSARSLLSVALPRLSKRSRHPQTSPLEVLIGQMLHKDVRKRPYSIGMVKQELQHLAAQSIPLKKRIFSRRTLLKWGGLAGLAGLAAASSWLTWGVETQMQGQRPITSYSPNLGGTIYTYDTHGGVLGVAWSPNGTRVAMGDWNGQVQAWDANTGLHVINFYDSALQSRVEAVIWLRDGKNIAAGGDDAVVWIWNAATGQVQRIYRGHADWVITLACSPDGKYIASGSKDLTVQVWEAATGRPVVTYGGHNAGIGSVAWSPDGRYIASASFDMTVQIWEATTGRHIFTYRGHTDEVYTVAWSPDGQRIASGGKGHTVHVWPVALFEGDETLQKSSIIKYRGHNSAVQAVAWSLDGKRIASAGDNVHIWNSLTGEHIYTYTKHTTSITLEVQAVAWSPNGSYIASGGMEGTVQVWNAR
jgi:hypothetical protein